MVLRTVLAKDVGPKDSYIFSAEKVQDLTGVATFSLFFNIVMICITVYAVFQWRKVKKGHGGFIGESLDEPIELLEAPRPRSPASPNRSSLT